MVSSHISQPALRKLDETAHPEVGESVAFFTFSNHTGLLENILQPLSETILYPLTGESGFYDGICGVGEASPRNANSATVGPLHHRLSLPVQRVNALFSG